MVRSPSIRQARPGDFARIEEWRSLHFAEMGRRRRAGGGEPQEVTGQADIATAAWAVAVGDHDEPLAAIGFRDDPEAKVRRVEALFSEKSRSGLRAGETLARMVEALSDRDGFEIRGSTDPENTDYLSHLIPRGYEIVAVEFRRRPVRAVEQQRAAAERASPAADRAE